MIRYIAKHEPEVSKLVGQWEKARALNTTLIWVLAGFLAFVIPLVSRFVFVLIFIFQPLIDRYFKKKKAKLEAESEV